MSDLAIKVENISKRYRIGLKEELLAANFSMLAPLNNINNIND